MTLGRTAQTPLVLYQAGSLGQLPYLLCALVSPSLKIKMYLPHRVHVRIKVNYHL